MFGKKLFLFLVMLSSTLPLYSNCSLTSSLECLLRDHGLHALSALASATILHKNKIDGTSPIFLSVSALIILADKLQRLRSFEEVKPSWTNLGKGLQQIVAPILGGGCIDLLVRYYLQHDKDALPSAFLVSFIALISYKIGTMLSSPSQKLTADTLYISNDVSAEKHALV
jgi:hypothetical protein